MSTQTPSLGSRPLLTPRDCAELARVSRDTIYRAVEAGELKALHAGRLLRIDRDDFRAWLERD
jgi:excisionase family DNA binding protein